MAALTVHLNAVAFVLALALIGLYVDSKVQAASVRGLNIESNDNTPGVQCADEFDNCATFKENRQCNDAKFERWMKKKCALTCGFCVPPTTTNCRDSPYGCCHDKITPADGPNKKGCGAKLCIDERVCDKYKSNCDSPNKIVKDWLKENCAATCGFCRAPASPKERCERRNGGFGCCWNGDDASGGCPACLDTTKRLCKLFTDKCESTFYNERQFMEINCPQTCGWCGASNCHDTKDKCRSWASQGLCTQPIWDQFLKKHCPRSCSLCDDGEQ